MPVIGGREPKKVLEHINQGISFAPDGKRFAYACGYAESGVTELVVAGLDGGEPRVLARREGNDWFTGFPAWSPDGARVVCPAATDTGGTKFTLIEVPAEGGAVKQVSPHIWHGPVYRPNWLKDGSGLVVNAKETMTGPLQVWFVSYPEGAVSRVTNDLTEYGSMSFNLTADSATLLTIASEGASKIWVAAPGQEEGGARKVTDGKYDGKKGLDWGPDGRVFYITQSGDSLDIWSVNADGSGRKQLTSNDDQEDFVRVSPDGRHVVFDSMPAGGLPHVWRMDADGSNPVQLTRGDFSEGLPFWSPDGQWVFFESWRSGKSRLWKVPAAGGEPAQVSDLAFQGWRCPPGSKLIFGGYYDEQASPPRWRLALLSPETGQIVKAFDFPPGTSNQDMLDERTLVYVEGKGDVDNVWSRPLEGGPPRQLTRFTSERIFWQLPSRDGKLLAISRGTTSADVILIKDFR